MDCLKRAIKIADVCMSSAKNLYLFINLLNKYLYYYSLEGVEFVKELFLTFVIDKCRRY